MDPAPRAAEDQTVAVADQLSPAQFAEEFDRVARQLWCVAAAVVGNRSLADDVLQEAAMVALRKLDQFRPGTSFVAWMARIIRFIGLNQARQLRRVRSLDVTDADVEPATDGMSRRTRDPVDGQGRLVGDEDAFDDRLLAALGSLEEAPRACLLLRTVLDLPYAQIARALDIPEGTAMSHVHRARFALRTRLAKEAPTAIPSRDRTSNA